MGHSPVVCSLSSAFSLSRPQKGFQCPTTLAKEVAPMPAFCLSFSSSLHVLPHPLPTWKGTGGHRALCSFGTAQAPAVTPAWAILTSRTCRATRQTLAFHSCQQPGIPPCSAQLCSSMKQKTKTTSVPRKGDILLEHICSAPKLLLSALVHKHGQGLQVFFGTSHPFTRARQPS